MTGSGVRPVGCHFLGWVEDSKFFYLYSFPWESVTDTEVGFGRVDMASEWASDTTTGIVSTCSLTAHT